MRIIINSSSMVPIYEQITDPNFVTERVVMGHTLELRETTRPLPEESAQP